MIFAGGVSMSGQKGKRVGDSLQQKRIPKERRQEVERVDESEIVPNRHVLFSIFGREIKENVEKQSKWVLFFHQKAGDIVWIFKAIQNLVKNQKIKKPFCGCNIQVLVQLELTFPGQNIYQRVDIPSSTSLIFGLVHNTDSFAPFALEYTQLLHHFQDLKKLPKN